MPTDPRRDAVFPFVSLVYSMWRRDKYRWDAMTCFIPTPDAASDGLLVSSSIITFSLRATPVASRSMLALTIRPTLFSMLCSRKTPRFGREGRMDTRSDDVKSLSWGVIPAARYSASVRAPSYTQPVIMTIMNRIHGRPPVCVCVRPLSLSPIYPV